MYGGVKLKGGFVMARFEFMEDLDREINKRVGKVIDKVTGDEIVLYHRERRDDFYDCNFFSTEMSKLIRLINKLERREFV